MSRPEGDRILKTVASSPFGCLRKETVTFLRKSHIITECSDTKIKIETEMASLQGELSSINDLMEKTFAVLSNGGPVEFVTSKLNELGQKQAELNRRLKDKTAERQELLSREAKYQRSKDEIRQLVARLQSPADDELYKLRAQIASQLKVLVQTLSIAPLGSKPRLEASIDRLRGSADPRAEDAIEHMSRRATRPSNSQRYFSVGFRDGNVRTVFPDNDDPL
jgi:chromosome segregation ATPase